MENLRISLSRIFLGWGYKILPEGRIKDCLSVGMQVGAELMMLPDDIEFSINVEVSNGKKEQTLH